MQGTGGKRTTDRGSLEQGRPWSWPQSLGALGLSSLKILRGERRQVWREGGLGGCLPAAACYPTSSDSGSSQCDLGKERAQRPTQP